MGLEVCQDFAVSQIWGWIFSLYWLNTVDLKIQDVPVSETLNIDPQNVSKFRFWIRDVNSVLGLTI